MKFKIIASPPKDDEEDNGTYSIKLEMKIKTSLDRYKIKRSLEPKYKIDKISYSEKDR